MTPFGPDAQLWTRFIDGRVWEVVRPLTWHDDVRGWDITVPVGFLTDYASIPRVLHPLLPKTGKSYTRAAVLHDYLYATGYVPLDPAPVHVSIPRQYADDVLRRVAAEDGCPPALRELMYRGVRLGGWAAWRKYRAGKGRWSGGRAQ